MLVDVTQVKSPIKPKAYSTMCNMRKDDLIDYIRTLEHNYNVAVAFNQQQAENFLELCGKCGSSRKVRTGGTYRHFKGKCYMVIGLARHTESGEVLVIYADDEGETWARPKGEFLSEVDREKYPDAKQKYRFEPVEESDEG